jgi:hypothetical protein
LEKGRERSNVASGSTAPGEREAEYTLIGIMEDGSALNRAVKEIRELGVGKDDLTVILKRQDPDAPEPFPEGTLYIVVPDDKRGLEVPIGFAVAFLLLGLFFAIIVPSIGVPTFMVFISLTAILLAGSFTRVGASPILTDMSAPREEAGAWNDQFELGKVLIFAMTKERRLIRPIREILQANGVTDSTYYVIDERLQPRAVGEAVLHRAGPAEQEGSGMDAPRA